MDFKRQYFSYFVDVAFKEALYNKRSLRLLIWLALFLFSIIFQIIIVVIGSDFIGSTVPDSSEPVFRAAVEPISFGKGVMVIVTNFPLSIICLLLLPFVWFRAKDKEDLIIPCSAGKCFSSPPDAFDAVEEMNRSISYYCPVCGAKQSEETAEKINRHRTSRFI